MFGCGEFQDSDLQGETINLHSTAKAEVSVLRHIPPAKKLLDGCPAYQLYSPRCSYTKELIVLPPRLNPKHEEVRPSLANRLFTMEDALYEHGKMKEKRDESHENADKESTSTLWDLYSDKQPIYSRFRGPQKKDNFAGVFLNVAGVNLDNKRSVNFPRIKSETKTLGNLIFDSHFEGGNLLCVYSVSGQSQSYDLLLQNDVNTKGHNQWFYFKATNLKKNQKVRFTIVNLTKKTSLFSYGMKPLVFSERQHTRNGTGWIRNGMKIVYQENNIRRQGRTDCYFSLSFEYEFAQANDLVYFAPYYPYNYSQLVRFLDGLLHDNRYAKCLTIKKLCETVGGNAVNILTISTGRDAGRHCKVVWILARQHPVETTGSYMVEGMIKHLCQLLHLQPEGSFYDRYIFKIVPMVNADGVIYGNARAEITGIDPNRVWKKTSKTLTPVISCLRKCILKAKEEVSLVLDLHSHSKQTGCFFYGNHLNNDPKACKLLPSLFCRDDPRFNFKNCRFRGGHEATARRVLFEELKQVNVYTVECSLLGYQKNNRIVQYRLSDYFEMGAKLIDSYFKMEMCKLEEVEKIKDSQLICDFCDVQSARSDSCVSDEEYPEVYSFTRAKKKLHNVVSVSVSKKERLRSNTTIQKSTTRERDSVKTMKSGVNLLPIQMKSDKIAKRIVLNEQEGERLRHCQLFEVRTDKENQIFAPKGLKKTNHFRNRNHNYVKNLGIPHPQIISIKEQCAQETKQQPNRSKRENSMHIDAGQSFKNDHHEFRIRSSTSEVEVPVKNKKPNQLMIVGSSMDDEAAQHGQNEGMIDPAISENIMKSCKSNQKNITSTRLEIEEDNQENAVIKQNSELQSKRHRKPLLMFQN